MSVSTEIIRLPEPVQAILSRLRDAGYSAYAVGGCVRDSLLGKTPHDWDICTAARPEEMRPLFAGWHVVETGLQHGTLTVVIDHIPYEVTAYRLDGLYTDHRHPDSVSFVRDVREDLRRRDFTVNAMAYAPEEGLIDLFGGREDLQKRLIRCVGEPEERFREDTLRILRALRFAACYDFAIEDGTAAAARAMACDVRRVAGERIRAEMTKLLCGNAAGRILRDFSGVITAVFPELAPMVGFDQHTPWHRHDVWEHTVRAVEAIAPEEALRWTMLLHDSGKPEAFFLDTEGIGHAHGHQKRSAAIAEVLFDRMHFDTRTRDRALLLIEKHDIDMRPDERLLMRQLNRYGEEAVRDLIAVHCADRKARGTELPGEADRWAEGMTAALDALLARQPCYTLASLAVNGKDLITAGFRPGPGLGQTLQALLERVMDGELTNDRETLLGAARSGLMALNDQDTN